VDAFVIPTRLPFLLFALVGGDGSGGDAGDAIG
jgi:hypothetical protein